MFFFWHQAPFVRMAIPFVTGIVASYYFQFIGAVYWWLLGVFVCLAAILLFRRHWSSLANRVQFGILAFCLFFSLGATRLSYPLSQRVFERHFHNRFTVFAARVVGIPEEKSKSVAVKVNITQVADSLGHAQHLGALVIAYLTPSQKARQLLPGDWLIFTTAPQMVSKPPNPYQFDYHRYLIKKGVVATVYLGENYRTLHGSNDFLSPGKYLHLIREWAIERFRTLGVAERELGVISALVLGKREMVAPGLRTAYTDAGVVHILAVSGLHVGIIYLFASLVIGRIWPGRWSSFYKLLILLAILWLYAAITGFSPSVLRAATMFSFVAIGKEGKRKANIYNMLGVSAMLLLIIDPFLLFEVGFQLSYLAVGGIVYFHPKIYGLWQAPYVVLDKVWSLLVVTVSAQVATFPLSLYYFHQFPNFFFITNIVVIPLAVALLYSGVVFLLVSWVPLVSKVFMYPVYFAAYILNESVLAVGHMPGAVSEGIPFKIQHVILLYLLIVSLAGLFASGHRYWLRSSLVCGLFFAISVSLLVIDNHTEMATAIFQSPGGAVLATRTGNDALLIPLGNTNPSRAEQSLRGYLVQEGISSIRWISSDSTAVFGFAALDHGVLLTNHCGVFLQGHVNMHLPVKRFIVLVKDARDVVQSSGAPGKEVHFVVHPELSKWKRAKLREELARYGVHVHDVEADGALILDG